MSSFASRSAVVAMIALVVGQALAQDKPAGAKPAAQEVKKADTKEAAAPERPSCVVMDDDPIDISLFTMTDDGPVFFCCEHCVEKFTADPAKYKAKVEKQRDALAKLPRVQTACPVSGKPVSKEAFVELDGKKIYFCCKGCPEGYKKDPKKYAKKLAAAYTYQTMCPVTNEPIDPMIFADLPSKQRIYFAHKECMDKFMKEPAKYDGALEKMGINIDPDKIKG